MCIRDSIPSPQFDYCIIANSANVLFDPSSVHCYDETSGNTLEWLQITHRIEKWLEYRLEKPRGELKTIPGV